MGYGKRFSILGQVNLARSPEVLADRAATLLDRLGASTAGDSAFGLALNFPYLNHIRKNDHRPERWDALQRNQPPPIHFWYRQSPEPLRNWNFFVWNARLDNPPLLVPGMATVVMDLEGRLVKLRVFPPSGETETADSQDLSADPDPPVPAWSPLFAAAGLDPAALTSAPSKMPPPFHSDRRFAWEGTYPEQPEMAIRIEAATYRGRPVSFVVLDPWELRGGLASESAAFGRVIVGFTIPLLLVTVFVGVWLARRNLCSGRADRRGALRLSSLVFGCTMLGWVLANDHTLSVDEFNSFMGALGEALLRGWYLWVIYCALEPSLRRRWPEGVVSWNRLLAGSIRNPLVGRDILIGGLLGTLAVVVYLGRLWALRGLGLAYDLSDDIIIYSLVGLRRAGAAFLTRFVFEPLSLGFALVFVFLLFYVLLRRKGLAAAVLLGLLLAALVPSLHPAEIVLWLLALGFAVLAVARFGLLASISSWFFFYLLVHYPMTTDFSAWYAGYTIFAVGLAAALGCYGSYTALAGQPLFPSLVSQEKGSITS